MDGPPLPGAGVAIDAKGRIAAVGPVAALPAGEGVAVERFSGVLMPGLVNLHTHLELTGLTARAEPTDFPSWIAEVRSLKARRSAVGYSEAAARGLQDAYAAGITTVADTGDSGAVLGVLAQSSGSGVVYQEVFGPDPGGVDESRAGLEAQLEALGRGAGGRVRLGVSPHAPYSVSAPLYRAVVDLARREGLPIAVHVAESRAETEFVVRGEGPFARAWRARGIPPLAEQARAATGSSSIRSPVAWLDRLGVLGPETLCIHAVQLDAEDVAVLAARKASIAHCPASNARHGHGVAPLRALLDAGLAVGVGTDSVLSVGRLDPFLELRTARAAAGLDARSTLALATTGAARALGLEGEIGRLVPGGWGDVVALAATAGPDPEEAVLGLGPEHVLATFQSGRPIFRRAGR
jgi:5-methylthioadenosine/S-adenosylhomocysteine deaminase